MLVVEGEVEVGVGDNDGGVAGSEVEEEEAGVDETDVNVGVVVIVAESACLTSVSASGSRFDTVGGADSFFSPFTCSMSLCSPWTSLSEVRSHRLVSDATQVSVEGDDEGEVKGEEEDEDEEDTIDELREDEVGAGVDSSSFSPSTSCTPPNPFIAVELAVVGTGGISSAIFCGGLPGVGTFDISAVASGGDLASEP